MAAFDGEPAGEVPTIVEGGEPNEKLLGPEGLMWIGRE